MVVKLSDDARQTSNSAGAPDRPRRAGPVMLANVASIELGSGPAVIDRYDRVRNVNIEVELNGQPLGEIEAKTMELPSMKQLPPGVARQAVGDAEAMGELFEGFRSPWPPAYCASTSSSCCFS